MPFSVFPDANVRVMLQNTERERFGMRTPGDYSLTSLTSLTNVEEENAGFFLTLSQESSHLCWLQSTTSSNYGRKGK